VQVIAGARVDLSEVNLRIFAVRRGEGERHPGPSLLRAVAKHRAAGAQARATCQVLNLVLGPLDLNLLGLVVQLYGPQRNQPVTLTITATRGGGVLGDLFCGLSGP
jgi:hypothetical protein